MKIIATNIFYKLENYQSVSKIIHIPTTKINNVKFMSYDFGWIW